MQVATWTYDELELLFGDRVDERAARATLRGQIARLEHELGSLIVDLWESGRTGLPSPGQTGQIGARLLTVGELEEIRDGLLERIDAARMALRERTETESRARAHLDEMLADPGAHRFHIAYRADLGEPSCGAYQVLPRLGLLGMLFGWWCVKVSSGCPLSRSTGAAGRYRVSDDSVRSTPAWDGRSGDIAQAHRPRLGSKGRSAALRRRNRASQPSVSRLRRGWLGSRGGIGPGAR